MVPFSVAVPQLGHKFKYDMSHPMRDRYQIKIDFLLPTTGVCKQLGFHHCQSLAIAQRKEE